ncbi:MAG: hypothetical protein R3F04_02840 [Lysobacteraceae bacterium]
MSRAIIGTLAPIKHVVHTLTADNGKESPPSNELIARTLQGGISLLAVARPRQRGTNENGNGLVRA